MLSGAEFNATTEKTDRSRPEEIIALVRQDTETTTKCAMANYYGSFEASAGYSAAR